jgi:hypothetical protein
VELCRLAGIDLHREAAGVFVAAAAVLLPRDLGLAECVRGGASPGPALLSALRALWTRTGMPAPAPTPMPLHPLSPGVFGVQWRRLRAALSQALRVEAE